MDDDRALYRRWLDHRDAEAFATLVRRHADLVHDVAQRIGGDRAAAEDALQESLIRLATDGTPRPAEIGVRAWLARAAIDRARNARRADRSRAGRERAVGEARKEAVVDVGPAVDSETVRGVEAALRRVDGDDAAILVLRFRHGVEYPELAAILDVSEGAARVRVHRATQALRRDEGLVRHDGRAIERALAGLPIMSFPAASLMSAIDVAIGAAGGSGAAGAGAAAATASGGGLVASLAALVPGGWVTLLAVAVAATGGTFVLVRGGGAARTADSIPGAGQVALGDAGSSRAADLRPTPADLAASPRVVGGPKRDQTAPGPLSPDGSNPDAPRAKKECVPGGPALPGKGPVSPPRAAPSGGPSDASSPRPPPTLHSPRVRAEIVSSDGSPIPITIDRVFMKGEEFPGSAAEGGGLRIPTSPGSRTILNVITKDRRALLPRLYVAVTDPVPETVVARFPAASDPRLDPLVVEVLDAVSGAPMPGATLDWQSPGARDATMTADSAGRITVVSTARSDGGVERGIAALLTRGFCIHASGFRSTSRVGWWIPREAADSPEVWDASGLLGIGLDQAETDVWRDRGTWTVRLERLPADLESKTVRVLFDDGRPAVGAVAYVTSAAPGPYIRALGAAVTPNDIDFGLRRVGPDGVIEFGARSRTTIEVFVAGCPVGAFALTRDRWPASGPREIRLAPLADVTLAIDGIPDANSAYWTFDPLGAARSLADGPIVPISWDDGFDPKTRDEEFLVATFMGQRDLFGELKSGRSEIRFQYPVGWARPLYVRVGDESRHYVVKAPNAGPVRLDVTWGDMEKGKTDAEVR